MKGVSYIVMILRVLKFEMEVNTEWVVIVAVDYWLIDGCRLFGVVEACGSVTWRLDLLRVCDEDR